MYNTPKNKTKVSKKKIKVLKLIKKSINRITEKYKNIIKK